MLETIITALPVAYVAVTALPLLVIDMKQHRLPNKIVLPMIAITFVSQLFLAVFTSAWASFGISLGIAFVVFVLGVFMNYKNSIGMGDVKLLTGLTMLLAWFSPLGAVLLAPVSLALGFVVTILILLKRSITNLPLGPIVLFAFASILTIALVAK